MVSLIKICFLFDFKESFLKRKQKFIFLSKQNKTKKFPIPFLTKLSSFEALCYHKKNFFRYFEKNTTLVVLLFK